MDSFWLTSLNIVSSNDLSTLFLPFTFFLSPNRFTPSIKAIVYHGDKKQRDEIRRKHMPRAIGPNFPIIVTSYEVAMADARRFLRHYKWKYLVVDEVSRLVRLLILFPLKKNL